MQRNYYYDFIKAYNSFSNPDIFDYILDLIDEYIELKEQMSGVKD